MSTRAKRSNKGQLLISLDDSTARSQVAAALAAVRGAQAELEALRHGGTRHEQITLTSDIDKAKAVRNQQAANLATLEKLQQQGAASTSEVDAARRALAADDASLKAMGQQQTQGYAPIDLQHATANLAQCPSCLQLGARYPAERKCSRSLCRNGLLCVHANQRFCARRFSVIANGGPETDSGACLFRRAGNRKAGGRRAGHHCVGCASQS